MSQFNPKRVLRQVSRPLLKAFFERQGHPLQVEWDHIAGHQIDEIFDAWQNLADGARKGIEILLQEIDDMAAVDGIKNIVEEAQYQQLDLMADLDHLISRHDKAIWTLLNHKEVWDNAIRFAQADGLAIGRYWVKRGELPKVAPDTSPAGVQQFRQALSSFYRQREGRGQLCKVEHLLRRNKQDYFFVYLSDYADVSITLDEQQELHRVPERQVFEVVFAYDREVGSLEMYAKGGKKIVEPLQRTFCRVILRQETQLNDNSGPAYQLDKLMNDFGFPTDAADGIAKVYVRSLRLTVVGQSRGRITLEADPEKGPKHIYEMLLNYLNRTKLHQSILHVTKATLRFEFGDGSRIRAFSFEVGFPNTCNLKSKREDQRVLGEKYLRRWNIDVCGEDRPLLVVGSGGRSNAHAGRVAALAGAARERPA